MAESRRENGNPKRHTGSSRLSETLVVLSDALAGLAAERSLSRVLQRIADLAREVVGRPLRRARRSPTAPGGSTSSSPAA